MIRQGAHLPHECVGFFQVAGFARDWRLFFDRALGALLLGAQGQVLADDDAGEDEGEAGEQRRREHFAEQGDGEHHAEDAFGGEEERRLGGIDPGHGGVLEAEGDA